MKKILEKYIQFAIDNGYSEGDVTLCSVKETQQGIVVDFLSEEFEGILIDILEKLITSKPFIEAVARGYLKSLKWASKGDYYYSNRHKMTFYTDCECIEYLTQEQAIAIRENKLDEFIEKILPKK